MRIHILSITLLLAAVSSAFAQEKPVYQKTFSVEVGTGIMPLHMTFSPSREVETAYAKKGQSIGTGGAAAKYPVIDITGVIQSAHHHEFTLSAGVSWCHHKVYQHSTWGIDPNGEPRYNLNDKTPIGWADSSPFFSLTSHWRYLWNPSSSAVIYSGLGLGLVMEASGCAPIPSVIPIALRYGGKHFYGYLENMIGPMATLIHGGLGWRF